MRDIKFQFIYKGLPFSSTDNGFNWHKKVYSLDDFMNNSLYELSDIHGSCELVAKRQFTGLTDKNGADIYEGDIFSGKSKVFGCITGEVQLCEYDDAEGYQHEKHLGWNINGAPIVDLVGDGLEVIGNIHQHPELLEK